MNEPKKRPGFWWLLFYGRRRRGFPWLLAAVFAAAVVLALVFAVPGGADLSRAVAAILLGGLPAAAVVLAVFAVLRPRRRP